MKRIKAYMCAVLFMGIGVLSQNCTDGNPPVYSEFIDLGTNGWDPINILPYNPYPIDSTMNPGERFDLILTVRYSLRGNDTSLPIQIYEESSLGVVENRRITVPLRNSRGEPLGRKGVVLYEVSDTLRRNFVLPPHYDVSITSLAPRSRTRSIRAIGLTLVPANH